MIPEVCEDIVLFGIEQTTNAIDRVWRVKKKGVKIWYYTTELGMGNSAGTLASDRHLQHCTS